MFFKQVKKLVAYLLIPHQSNYKKRSFDRAAAGGAGPINSAMFLIRSESDEINPVLDFMKWKSCLCILEIIAINFGR